MPTSDFLPNTYAPVNHRLLKKLMINIKERKKNFFKAVRRSCLINLFDRLFITFDNVLELSLTTIVDVLRVILSVDYYSPNS